MVPFATTKASLWPLAGKVQVRSRASPYEIYGRQRGTKTGFSRLQVSPVSIITIMFHIHFILKTTHIRKTSGQRQGIFEQNNILSDIWKHWTEK